jgi:hypothetical protein
MDSVAGWQPQTFTQQTPQDGDDYGDITEILVKHACYGSSYTEQMQLKNGEMQQESKTTPKSIVPYVSSPTWNPSITYSGDAHLNKESGGGYDTSSPSDPTPYGDPKKLMLFSATIYHKNSEICSTGGIC